MEFQKDTNFISGRLKSFKYAIRGAGKLILSEHSIIAQCAIGLLTIIMGFVFEITATEWMFQIMAIGLILSIEGINTAVEKIADFIHPDFNTKIGFIKDVAAGAVFFSGITALILGAIIYTKYVVAFIDLHFK